MESGERAIEAVIYAAAASHPAPALMSHCAKQNHIAEHSCLTYEPVIVHTQTAETATVRSERRWRNGSNCSITVSVTILDSW
jgi:hypothetical protein